MRTIEILREYFVIFSRNISRSLIDNDFTIKLSLRKETSLSVYFIADFMVGSKKEKNEKKNYFIQSHVGHKSVDGLKYYSAAARIKLGAPQLLMFASSFVFLVVVVVVVVFNLEGLITLFALIYRRVSRPRNFKMALTFVKGVIQSVFDYFVLPFSFVFQGINHQLY